jgi:hypothetical protein
MRVIGYGLDFAHPKPDCATSDGDSEDADDWVGERVDDHVVYHDFPPWSTGRSEENCLSARIFFRVARVTDQNRDQ